MIQKYFPLDKNYILRKAQSDSEDHLLTFMIRKVVDEYTVRYNPLGLEDDTFLNIRNCSEYQLTHLELFYAELSAIYRYKFNETQLELIFDGRSHYDKYRQEWEETFIEWVEDFCGYSNFLKAVLESAVIADRFKRTHLAQARMKYFLSRYFELKVYKYKGVQEYKLA